MEDCPAPSPLAGPGVSEAGAFEEPRLPTADELDPSITAAEAAAAIDPINSAAIYIDNCVKRVQSRTDRAVNALQDSISSIASSLSASRVEFARACRSLCARRVLWCDKQCEECDSSSKLLLAAVRSSDAHTHDPHTAQEALLACAPLATHGDAMVRQASVVTVSRFGYEEVRFHLQDVRVQQGIDGAQIQPKCPCFPPGSLVNSLLDGEVLIPLLDVRGEPVAGVELDDISVAVKESETCTINQATLVKESETGIESFLRLSLNWNNRWMPIEKAITLCLSVNSIPIGEYSIETLNFGLPLAPDAAMQPTESMHEGIKDMVNKLGDTAIQVFSKHPQISLDAVRAIRKLISVEAHPPISEVIAVGIAPKLVSLLQHGSSEMQAETGWALLNISSGKSAHTHYMIDLGVVQVFLDLLFSPHEDVRDKAIWGLGNIAGDSPKTRDILLGHTGIVQAMCTQLNVNTKLSVLRNTVWVLSNFCRGKPPPSLALVKDIMLPLREFAEKNLSDDEVLIDACWAFSYVAGNTSNGGFNERDVVISSGVLPLVASLLPRPNPTVVTPALRTIGTIAAGTDEQTRLAVEAGILPHLAALFSSQVTSTRKEALWTISNIMACDSDIIQMVIDAGVIPHIIAALEVRNERPDILKEAALALSNITSKGTPKQLMICAIAGAVQVLIASLPRVEEDCQAEIMEGLFYYLVAGNATVQPGEPNPCAAMIVACGGVDPLAGFAIGEPDSPVGDKALALLEKFFPGEYAEAMNAEHVAGAETDVDDMDVSGDGSGSEASDTESLPEVGDLLLQGDSESDSDVDPGVVQLQVHVEDE